MRAVNENDKVR